jgi:hypothetical protein
MAYQLAVDLLEGSKRKLDTPPAPKPEAIIARLIEDAKLMLSWYEQREYHGKGQFWKRLEPREKSLQTFLSKTILPCLEILRAGLSASGLSKSEFAEAKARLRFWQNEAKRGRLPYRPLYNLACYEAAHGQVLTGVEYLLRALHDAPPSRQAALLARAESDVTLKEVLTDPDFEVVRRVFDPVAKDAPPAAGPLEVLRRLLLHRA